MLTFMGIGDAWAVPYEFVELKDHHPYDLKAYATHPVLPIEPAHYTDDTQMALAVVEAMLSSPGLLRQPNYARYFFEAYKRDPRLGYGSGFKTVLDLAKTVEQMQILLLPTSSRSGAIMRAPPLGGYASYLDVIEQAERQARVTHNTPIAIECAQAVALAFHYLYHNKGARSMLGAYLNHTIPLCTVDWTEPYADWSTVSALDCARRALTVWSEAQTTDDILLGSVRFGGDTDTIAAVAMALAWADPVVVNTIPDELMLNMESGKYGFHFLYNLTLSWTEAFPRVHD